MIPDDSFLTASFAAMGGVATVTLDGPPGLLRRARRRLVDLEEKWSRFLPESEITRVNAHRGEPVRVSEDTRLLVRCGVTAWRETDGSFDPTVLDSMVAWGYSRDFPDVERPPEPLQTRPAAGMGDVRVDDVAGTVDLAGVGFDPGGIGKGLAADFVATEVIAAGARAALVDVCGDLRVVAPPGDDRWTIGLEDPADPSADLLRIQLTDGGVATSSTRRRRWRTERGRSVHHLHDPRFGGPAATALRGVSVLAGEAWWADALTKCVLVGGVPSSEVGTLGASAIGRRHDGVVVGTDDLLGLHREAA